MFHIQQAPLQLTVSQENLRVFASKYLKYKSKYMNLKNQLGGLKIKSYTDGENKINIVNDLNEHIIVLNDLNNKRTQRDLFEDDGPNYFIHFVSNEKAIEYHAILSKIDPDIKIHNIDKKKILVPKKHLLLLNINGTETNNNVLVFNSGENARSAKVFIEVYNPPK